MAPTLVEVSDAPEGLTEIKVKDSRGIRIGFFQVDTSCMDDELKEDLVNWQARHTNVGGSLSIKLAASRLI